MIFVNINSKTKFVKIIDLSKSVDIFLVKNVHNVGNCIVLANKEVEAIHLHDVDMQSRLLYS